MELAKGRPYANGALPEFDPPTRRRIYEQLIDTLADLHNIDPEPRSSATSASPAIISSARWRAGPGNIAICRPTICREMERLIAFLPETLPEQSRMSIVHGDYRIDNVVFDGDGTLTAVLDWELATLGDPLADFSYLAMQWVMPADGGAGLAGLDLAALGIPRSMRLPSVIRSARACRSPASSTGTLPTICSGWPGSSRASRSASSTAPRAMPRPPKWPSACRCSRGRVGFRKEGGRLNLPISSRMTITIRITPSKPDGP